jgi:hypothetical protein
MSRRAALLAERIEQGAEALAALSQALSDTQWRAAAVSLNSDAPLTAQFLIEDHAVRHSWHHLETIRVVVQGM